ncbi:family 78 glycoside hydrolase catalytic domain, partial [bacterium]|nr:family 78 glycoside hydrolase catalytic domain [bacterium]
MEVFKTVNVTEPRPGVYVYDLGQNFSGLPKITVRGLKGTKVKLIPGELLDEHGLVNQKGSGEPSYFTYTLKGNGLEVWNPRFTYYGFRYVQVEGATDDPEKISKDKAFVQDIEGHFIHSSAETVGNFSCSNQLFNKIHKIIDVSILSNLQSILTDCPHREKLGWLEVSHLMAPSIMYNYDVPLFYRKIIQDMAEAQFSNGFVPNITPEFYVTREFYRDSPEWGSAYVIAPWFVYQMYGDINVLRDNYDGMKRYVEYLKSRAEGHIISYGLGDWCDVGPKDYGVSQNTPKGITATAIYYYDIQILKKTAELLDNKQDVMYYSLLAEKVKKAFNDKFFDAGTNQYATGSQTSNAMPLFMGIADSEKIPAILENIIKDVRKHDNHLTVGEVGLRFLI